MLAYQPFLKLAGACALLAITGVSLASCGDRCRALPAAKTAGWEAGDEREPTGTSTDSRIKGAGEQSWALALDLLRITDPGEHPSIASSPASMTFGLGLAYARWPQACHGTILAAIHALESGDALHQTLGASIRELGSRAREQGPEGEDPIAIHLRPSTWTLGGDGGVEPAENPVHEIYGATPNQVARPDTDERRGAVREVINCTIEEQSQGLLVDFMPPEYPRSDTTSFDVNVAVLTGPWESAFEDYGAEDFFLDDGTVASQDMIGVTTAPALYYETERLVAVSVPLRERELSVMLVMPREGAFADLAAFTADVTLGELQAAREEALDTLVDLTMPRFTVDSTTIEYSKELGLMCDMYTLRDVLHGAAIEIDEHGIKAAAATVVESWDTSSPEGLYVLINRPFLFFAYDHETDFVLFSGRYAGPKG